ncbi:MAG: alpha/beta fold hydrolase [Elusimicrobia bacterium]|nr:alpha/beta fold hydrolase [Elusimicrobiota bacterium]
MNRPLLVLLALLAAQGVHAAVEVGDRASRPLSGEGVGGRDAAKAAPAADSAKPAAARKAKVLPGILVDLTTRDGWLLRAKYVPAKESEPTFLLLHAKGRRMEDWYYLGRALANWGYGYLALDFRGHGSSLVSPEGQKVNWREFKITKTYNEFANLLQDVGACVAYLTSQGVAEEDIGVIGAEVGSSIGLKYAAVHPKVPMAVMLSPGLRYQEVLTVNAMRAYKGRPILMIHSEADKKSAAETLLLANIAKRSTGEANTTVLIVPKERGTKMLNGSLARKIVDWIAEPVQVSTGSVGAVPVDSGAPAGAELPQPSLREAPEEEAPYPRAADDFTRPDPSEAP